MFQKKPHTLLRNYPPLQKPAPEMISHLPISARRWEVEKKTKIALKGSHDCYSNYFFNLMPGTPPRHQFFCSVCRTSSWHGRSTDQSVGEQINAQKTGCLKQHQPNQKNNTHTKTRKRHQQPTGEDRAERVSFWYAFLTPFWGPKKIFFFKRNDAEAYVWPKSDTRQAPQKLRSNLAQHN